MKTKSPFFIKQEFISPLMCEQICDNLNLFTPDYDKDDIPLRTVKFHNSSQDKIFDSIEDIVVEVEDYYNVEYSNTERMLFEWYPEECKGESSHCENSQYVKNTWMRTKERDLTGVLFLSDYQEKTPFDGDFEVYGGKLEFPQHHFGFNAQRGTLVLFPSDPHFVNNTTKILAGDLYQVRFHIATKIPFLYNPAEFPGNYVDWLKSFA